MSNDTHFASVTPEATEVTLDRLRRKRQASVTRLVRDRRALAEAAALPGAPTIEADLRACGRDDLVDLLNREHAIKALDDVTDYEPLARAISAHRLAVGYFEDAIAAVESGATYLAFVQQVRANLVASGIDSTADRVLRDLVCEYPTEDYL